MQTMRSEYRSIQNTYIGTAAGGDKTHDTYLQLQRNENL